MDDLRREMTAAQDKVSGWESEAAELDMSLARAEGLALGIEYVSSSELLEALR